MSFSNKTVLLAAVTAAALMAGSLQAQAGGFALREQSTIGLGNAFAGSAAGGAGLSSMFWNPATMTDFAGLQSSSSFSLILPYANTTPSAATLGLFGGPTSTGDIAQDAVLPASYSSWQIADKVWIGLAINSPFGLITRNPVNYSGQIYGRTSKVTTYNVNPNVAFQLTDWLSVGAGLQVEYFKVRLTNAIGAGLAAAAPGAATGELIGKDTAIGYTLGATIKPWAGTEIGIGYRSRIEQKLDGTLNLPVAAGGLPAGVYGINSNITLPDQVTVGVRQKLTQDFTVLAGFEWTHWNLFSRFPVTSSVTGAQITSQNYDFRNGWFASLGGEYAWNQNLTVRAGLGFERSPITNATRGVRLPDSDRIWTTAGLSYKWSEKLSLDASYAHLFAKSGQINIVAGNPVFAGAPFVGNVKAHVDIVSVGFTYRWDDPKPARVVVAKY